MELASDGKKTEGGMDEQISEHKTYQIVLKAIIKF